MTDSAIIAASYAAERNYSHNPDDVINASDAVLAIGTEKVDTTTLKDRSLNNNDADIHGAMPTEGFIQGRRFDGGDNFLDCGNDSSLDITNTTFIEMLMKTDSVTWSFPFARNTSHLCIVYDPDCKVEFRIKLDDTLYSSGNGIYVCDNIIHHILGTYDGTKISIYVDGILRNSLTQSGIPANSIDSLRIGHDSATGKYKGVILFTKMANEVIFTETEKETKFNTLARLPFWSVNYTDYPDNVTTYTDNLPYSSSIINSGTFKVDDDKLQCVSAGTITYSASYEFDGSEYIKVEIDGVEYAGSGTITHGTTTVSVAQGSNKVTIQAGTGDTIDKIDIQFRAEV